MVNINEVEPTEQVGMKKRKAKVMIEDEVEVVGFIEVVKPKVFREAAAYEQRIPDNIQKVDALNDFISSLDPILQKDPKSIRAVRVSSKLYLTSNKQQLPITMMVQYEVPKIQVRLHTL
jgi:hypothetical protein